MYCVHGILHMKPVLTEWLLSQAASHPGSDNVTLNIHEASEGGGTHRRQTHQCELSQFHHLIVIIVWIDGHDNRTHLCVCWALYGQIDAYHRSSVLIGSTCVLCIFRLTSSVIINHHFKVIRVSRKQFNYRTTITTISILSAILHGSKESNNNARFCSNSCIIISWICINIVVYTFTS